MRVLGPRVQRGQAADTVSRVRSNATVHGGPAASGVQAVGQGVQQMGQGQAQREANLERSRRLQEERDRIQATQDYYAAQAGWVARRDELMQTRGVDAMNAADAFEKERIEYFNQAQSKVQSEVGLKEFARINFMDHQSEIISWRRHVATQTERASHDAADARIAAAANRIARHEATNPLVLIDIENIRRDAVRPGMPPDVASMAQFEAVRAAALQHIDTRIYDAKADLADYDRAMESLNQFEPNITAEDYAKRKGMIENKRRDVMNSAEFNRGILEATQMMVSETQLAGFYAEKQAEIQADESLDDQQRAARQSQLSANINSRMRAISARSQQEANNAMTRAMDGAQPSEILADLDLLVQGGEISEATRNQIMSVVSSRVGAAAGGTGTQRADRTESQYSALRVVTAINAARARGEHAITIDGETYQLNESTMIGLSQHLGLHPEDASKIVGSLSEQPRSDAYKTTLATLRDLGMDQERAAALSVFLAENLRPNATEQEIRRIAAWAINNPRLFEVTGTDSQGKTQQINIVSNASAAMNMNASTIVPAAAANITSRMKAGTTLGSLLDRRRVNYEGINQRDIETLRSMLPGENINNMTKEQIINRSRAAIGINTPYMLESNQADDPAVVSSHRASIFRQASVELTASMGATVAYGGLRGPQAANHIVQAVDRTAISGPIHESNMSRLRPIISTAASRASLVSDFIATTYGQEYDVADIRGLIQQAEHALNDPTATVDQRRNSLELLRRFAVGEVDPAFFVSRRQEPEAPPAQVYPAPQPVPLPDRRQRPGTIVIPPSRFDHLNIGR